MKITECSTCGANLASGETFSIFPCPNCGKEIIARCAHCKKLKNNYTCSNCGFVGP